MADKSKFIARLTGESDGHIETCHFDNFAKAQAWLQGEGLHEFDDQTARSRPPSQQRPRRRRRAPTGRRGARTHIPRILRAGPPGAHLPTMLLAQPAAPPTAGLIAIC
jgi:hypothetical protein